ncbi:MAG: GIY-YIG nuclease family protein [Candidatus Sungiibacteriota bacterium]|uniref:GIY-YIG nuclease family protein n=1 Tax=Candidatus Sungiibacteriota bacterium TaxID=2750080 RepID=A0A7T5USI0_9BACT|nr:MAG: GIY-YIG nuclease family protein [Candidatus Sungbacteria bacterium]
MVYYVYILYSDRFDRFYIGQTNNINLRLRHHNFGKSSWTKSYRPWRLIHSESFQTRTKAMQREKYLKSLKDKRYLLRFL